MRGDRVVYRCLRVSRYDLDPSDIIDLLDQNQLDLHSDLVNLTVF